MRARRVTRYLDGAGPEAHVDELAVQHEHHLPVGEEGVEEVHAVVLFVALVIRVHGHRGVAEHRLDTRRRHHHLRPGPLSPALLFITVYPCPAAAQRNRRRATARGAAAVSAPAARSLPRYPRYSRWGVSPPPLQLLALAIPPLDVAAVCWQLPPPPLQLLAHHLLARVARPHLIVALLELVREVVEHPELVRLGARGGDQYRPSMINATGVARAARGP